MESTKGRGRGRGRVKAPAELKEPDQAALERVKREQASVADSKSGTLSPVTPDQVADPPDFTTPEQRASQASQQAWAPTTSQQVPDVLADAKTTTGKGQIPPLAEDLKKMLQQEVQVSTPSYSSTITISTASNKLNPAAANFVPKSVTLDPNSSTFSPSHPQTSTSSPPIFTKHSIPTSTSSSTSSHLNPSSKEFVPSGFPPADLPGMVSQPEANGDPGPLGNGDFYDEEESGDFLTEKDIMHGYEKAAPTRTDDIGSEPVLKGAAGMLLKVFNYPGSFDEIGKNFKATLRNWVPSDSTLANLAEMLVHWSVWMSDLRYSACRVCELIADMGSVSPDDIGARFGKQLLLRLRAWHVKCYDKDLSTEQDKYLFACYSGFFAEIFAKIRYSEEPLQMLCPTIFQYVKALLSMREDFYVREACNILKLTGSTLVHVKGYDESQMVAVVKMMNELVIDKTLSQTCTALIMQVVELSGSKWTTSTAPMKFSTSDAQNKMGTAGLNLGATPFVPLSEPSVQDPSMLFAETFYDPPIIQQPVSCADDWDDFVGEDQPVEASNNSPDVIEEDDYDGLDPDIELEMEAFIDEIEEHLMLQDFDPELQDIKRKD